MNRILFHSAVAFGVLLAGGRAEAQSQGGAPKPLLQITMKSAKEVLNKVGDLVSAVKKEMGEGEDPQVGMMKATLDNPQMTKGFDVNKPIAIRIMYKPPAAGMPIDGDILVMLPVTDQKQFEELLSKANLPGFKADGGKVEFDLPIPNFPVKAHGRFADGYYYLTVVDPMVIDSSRAPKPDAMFASAKHDLSISIGFGAIPPDTVRSLFTQLQNFVAQMAPGQKQSFNQKDLENIAQTDVMEFHVDVQPADGKVSGELVVTARPDTQLATTIKNSGPGTLRAAIGLAPDAVIAYGIRGAQVGQANMFDNFLQAVKNNPAIGEKEEIKKVSGVIESLATSELEDMAASIAPDGTILFAAAVKSTAAFELKVADLPERKNYVTVGGVKLAHFEDKHPKHEDRRVHVYLGAKDEIAFMAVAFTDSTSAVEAALKRQPISDHKSLSLIVKLKDAANAVGVSGYSGNETIRMESPDNAGRVEISVPVLDIAKLAKLGLFDKLGEKFK